MNRAPILNLLQAYSAANPPEQPMVLETMRFIQDHADCFDRSLLIGHVTGSAWILDETLTHTLLIHHVKLDRWFQPGGHCDGNPDVLATARQEAWEETGLDVTPLTGQIFDVDIHAIPAKAHVPAHLHYDIRFAFTAKKQGEDLAANREIKAGAWLLLDAVAPYNSDASVLRMVDKTRRMQSGALS